jgi:hypothetical protein
MNSQIWFLEQMERIRPLGIDAATGGIEELIRGIDFGGLRLYLFCSRNVAQALHRRGLIRRCEFLS